MLFSLEGLFKHKHKQKTLIVSNIIRRLDDVHNQLFPHPWLFVHNLTPQAFAVVVRIKRI